jgi:hypothetical protein
MESGLQYASIIRINSTNLDYDNQLFFINYINHERVELISSKSKEAFTLLIGEDGTFDDEAITDVEVLYSPPEGSGYAKINGLLPGKVIDIHFGTSEPFIITGEIINLENDIIEIKPRNEWVEQNIFIDFHYGGVDSELNITNFTIKYDENFIHNTDADEDEEIDEEKENEVIGAVPSIVVQEENNANSFVYNVEQQINDYIDHFYYGKDSLSRKERAILANEIQKYVQLRSKYTSFDKTIKRKRLPTNPILHANINLQNMHLFKPVTSNVAEHFSIYTGEIPTKLLPSFISDEDDDDVVFGGDNVVKIDPDHFSKQTNEINEMLKNSKTNDHNSVNNEQLKFVSNVEKIMKSGESSKILIDFNGSNVSNIATIFDSTRRNVFSYCAFGVPYMENNTNVDATPKLRPVKLYEISRYAASSTHEKYVVNGFLFPPERNIEHKQLFHDSQSILMKSNTNLYPFVEFKIHRIDRHPDSDIFSIHSRNKKNNVYYPLFKSENIEEYFSKFDLDVESIFKTKQAKQSTSLYDLLKILNFYNVYETNNSDTEKLLTHLKRLIEKRQKVYKNIMENAKKIKNSKISNSKKYENIREIPKLIRESYINENTPHNNYMSNSETISLCDKDNDNLLTTKIYSKFMDLTLMNDQINEVVRQLNEDMKIMNNEKIREIKTSIVKIYPTHAMMKNDNNKLILKDIKDDEGKIVNPYDFLYSIAMDRLHGKYNDKREDFAFKVSKILDSNDINDESHEDMFQSTEIIQEIREIIDEHRVKQGEKCFVEETKTTYIYDNINSIWKEDVVYDEKLKIHKLIKYGNKDQDNINAMKEKLVLDDVKELLKLNEGKFDEMQSKSRIESDRMIVNAKMNLSNIEKVEMNKREKYNRQKLDFEYQINMMDGYGDKIVSPYYELFMEIIDNTDLDEKFTQINRFIHKFTSDQNDYWYFCKETNTQLVPKFFHTLSNAYLVTENYEDVLNDLCYREGELSDDGSSWVHKETGFVLKRINFDNEEGYDDNGMKTKSREVLQEINDDIDDLIDNIYDFEQQNMTNNSAADMNRNFNDLQKSVYQILNYYLEELGILISDEKRQSITKIASKVYSTSIRIEKGNLNEQEYNLLKGKHVVYSTILTMLIFVQTHIPSLKISKTFPGCKTSFQGYPTSPDDGIAGIKYVGCFIHSISRKLGAGKNEGIYIKISKMNQSEILQDMVNYVKSYIMNVFEIQSLVEAKRRFEREKFILEGDHESHDNDDTNALSFVPSLGPIVLNEQPSENLHTLSKNAYQYVSSLKDIVGYNMKMLEKNINDIIVKKDSLLYSGKQSPYLVNACCQDIYTSPIEYFTKEDKETMESLAILRKSSTVLLEHFDVKTLKVLKMLREPRFTDVVSDNVPIYDSETIYSGMIKILNFDNNKNIPNYLDHFGFTKPMTSISGENKSIYKKSDNIDDKIKSLTDQGYNFTQKQFVDALMLYHKNKNVSDNSNTKEIIMNHTENRDKHEITQVLGIKYEDLGIESFLKKIASYSDKIRQVLMLHDRRINNKFDIINSVFVIRNLERYDSNQLLNRIALCKSCINLIVSFIPNNIKNGTLKKNVKNFYCKHWNLASQHRIDITENFNKNLSFITEAASRSQPVMEYIESCKFHELAPLMSTIYDDIDDKFGNVEDRVVAYHSILLRCLYAYVESPLVKQRINMNIFTASVEMVHQLTQKYKESYSDISSIVKKIKQQEKKMKTDGFKNMDFNERRVENLKKNLKLGAWAMALDHTRITKYNQKYYDEDKIEALAILNMGENATTGLEEVQDEDERIYNEEMIPLNALPNDDEYDEGMDGDELF